MLAKRDTRIVGDLLKALNELIADLFSQSRSMDNFQTDNSKKVYEAAKAALGIDVTPRDIVPDAVGCAEAVNELVRRATGRPVGGGASTAEMFRSLLDENRFTQTTNPLPGDIIISPTGYSVYRKSPIPLPHGHVGIVAKQGILSNDSESGKILLNYTLDTWAGLFNSYGGYPVHIFRIK